MKPSAPKNLTERKASKMKKVFLIILFVLIILQSVDLMAATYYIWFLPSGGCFYKSNELMIRRNQGPYIAKYWINLRERQGNDPFDHKIIDVIGPFEINRGFQYHYLEEYWPQLLDDWLLWDFIIEIKIEDKAYKGSKNFWNTIAFLNIYSDDTLMEQYMPVFFKTVLK